jgi:hypothetical protein
MWTSGLIGGAAILLQLLNVTGVFFHHVIGPYYAGLLCLLALAGISFARLLPVGRAKMG